MTTIGYATLQIIPSLQGVSAAIEQQISGKAVEVKVIPKPEQRAVEQAGRQTRERIEQHTRDVKVAPKVDERAAQDAGKRAGDAAARGASGTALGQVIVGTLQGIGEGAGREFGEKIRDSIPVGMSGTADKIGSSLRNSLPTLGANVGTMVGTAIGVKVADAIGKTRLDRAGTAMATGLTAAIKKAKAGTEVGLVIGSSVAGGLSATSGAIEGAAGKIAGTIDGIGGALLSTKQLLGGDDSWAAPGLDILNGALGKATPLLEGMSTASALAAAGAQTVSAVTGVAAKMQALWNVALAANPIGLVVVAIAAFGAALVLAYKKSETFRAIVDGAWNAVKATIGAVVSWFTDTAWPAIQSAWKWITDAFSRGKDLIGVAIDGVKVIWQGLMDKAGAVKDWIVDKWNGMVDFFKGLPAKIASAATGMWNGLKSGLVDVLNWISDKWNDFADAFSFDIGDTHIGFPTMPTFSNDGFSAGGYTGNHPANAVAGVVHGGEFVVRKERTDQIRNAMPGLLDYLNGSGALPGYAGGGLVAGAQQLRKVIAQKFGISNIGGWRPGGDGYDEHVTGRALDVMTSSKGDAVKDFAIQNASAIDLKWAIWKQRMWYPNGSSTAMENRGDPTQNHMDHVHIFMGEGIANGLRGPLAQTPRTRSARNRPRTPAASTPSPSTSASPGLDADSSAAAVAPEAAAAASTSFSLSAPGSLSGFGSWGGQMAGDQIGASLASSLTPEGGQLDPRLKTAVGGLGNLGSAAGSAVDGQIASAMGVFGMGSTPGWLQGVSKLVGGMSFGGESGASMPTPSTVGGSAATSAVGAAANVLGSVHGGSGAAPGVTYNIKTATVEDAVLVTQRREKERAAATLGRF